MPHADWVRYMSERLIELLEVARGKSGAARSKLVENITDMFLKDEWRLTDHERALMTDILSKLVSEVEANVRKELAEALARSGEDLPEVVNILANDEIEIARPLLEKSPLLQDPDLIEIIRMRTEEHRVAIANRDELSEGVSNALVDYGGPDAIEALLNNHDAQLSQRAMEYLVTESRRVDRFQEPLVAREDLPGELAYKMFWWVSAAIRKRILSEHQVDPLQLEGAVRRAARAALVDHSAADGAYVKAQKLVRRMSESGELTITFLINALRQRRLAVFVAGLAELGGITFRTAWRIFSDKGGESFAIIAKAIGVERSQFTSLYLLVLQVRDGGTPKSPGVVKSVMALFDAVSDDNARGALMVWQRDAAYQLAIDELDTIAI